jgi:DNA-binding response OmpR family regulator
MKAGADDFVTKPFDLEELSARLHVAEESSVCGLVKQLEGLLPKLLLQKDPRQINQWTGL